MRPDSRASPHALLPTGYHKTRWSVTRSQSLDRDRDRRRRTAIPCEEDPAVSVATIISPSYLWQIFPISALLSRFRCSVLLFVHPLLSLLDCPRTSAAGDV
jgi:hypothetical protein